MKRKLGIIILISVVSITLVLLGRGIKEPSETKSELNKNTVSEITTTPPKAEQDNTSNKVNTTEDSQQASVTSTKNTTPDNSKPVVSTNSNVNTQVKQTPQVKANLTIVDTITGNVIIARATQFTGLSVADATCKLLDSAKIAYKTSGFGDTIYFSSINGLRERGSGSLSGWCYYINGKKASIGAGAYKLNKDDILEWKYLKDGSLEN